MAKRLFLTDGRHLPTMPRAFTQCEKHFYPKTKDITIKGNTIMLRTLLSIFLSVMSLTVMAQSMSVTSFELDEMDLAAITPDTKVIDQNGETCALIRIQTKAKGFVFDVGMLGVTKTDDNHVGEVWVYVPRGVKYMTIRHAQFDAIERYRFPVSIEQGRTYVMRLATAKVHTIVEEDDGLSYFTLNVTPATAMVTVDNEAKSLDPDGSLILRLTRGSHSYTVQAPGYAPQTATFTLGVDRLSREIRLESVLASLSVTCATPGASLYVNDQLKASGSQWTGALNAGTYLVEARKEGYYSAKETVSLAQKESRTVSLPALTMRTGALNVNYKPLDCEVWVDGKRLGTSPNVFRGVMIGQRKVTLKKDGYVTKELTADVREGETAMVSGALEKSAPVASASGGVGGGSSASGGAAASVGGTLEFNVKGVRFVMVPVQGGTFTMGATPEQGSDAASDEKPAHKVTLSSYYIGQTEVTQELWTAVMGSNPSYHKGNGSNLPVEQVSWNDCQTFITKLNAITGRRFRLPTEAEWEYAARGGNKSKGYKYSGGNDIGSVAWYCDNSDRKTHTVATKAANELGIYDMSGNVYEWCQDWYGDYSSVAQTNPTGATSGSYRVYRGGSWGNSAGFCRSSFRNYCEPSISIIFLGLRLVLSE